MLESSNRDTLSLLEAKSTAYDSLAEELTAQHQKTVELRRKVSTLEQSIQAVNSTAASATYHEQGLQQEIEHLKRSNEWLDKELKTKSEEYSKYRKEKSARISELQRQNDESTSTIDGLNGREHTIRKRYEEVSQKADDCLSRIQQLHEEGSRKDEAFSVELNAANRLAELMKHSAKTEKQRQQDLQAQLETTKEDAAEQIGRITAEMDTEHCNREASERRIVELEVEVERLEADVQTFQNQPQNPANAASSPGANGYLTPGREGSATRVFSSSFKGGLSITQMYSDFNDLQAELNHEKARNEKLATTINDMIQDMEARQPEIEELTADHERLRSELAEMSSLFEVVGKERDQAVKEARKREGHVEARIREGEVLRQQLRDLSSQVKVLLMEVHLRDQGHVELNAERHLQLERMAQGQIDEHTDGVTDTDRLISENLVTFRNVAELQEQNMQLIKVTREVGERMEHEEALRKQSEVAQDHEDLRQNYERCKDEIKSLITQSQSYIRERDMFRRMLLHRGQLPHSDLASMFADSIDEGRLPATPRQGGVIDSIEQSPSSRDMADYAKLLKEMQSHFDAYRHEAATDRSMLKEQVDGLSKSNGEFRNEVARSNSQVLLAHERYEMLQANYAMLKTENSELQKKSQFFLDNVAKQDLRTQQVAEDLVEAKGLIDSMRNEIANLKAEKEFWKSVERRLMDENENFLNERTRLNALNANLQNVLNEREYSETESRRRLQGQAESAENELETTKKKLLEEVEANKNATLRREYDHQHAQKRIDDLISSLGSSREELVAAKTTRDHLQARLDEMIIELRSAEERVHVLRPTSAMQPATTNGGEAPHEASEGAQSTFSKEQELAIEVSELRRDLGLTKSELESAKSQVEQYKAISQSSEEELASLNDTQELYHQETDKAIRERDSKIRELEERIVDIGSELASTNGELSAVRTSQTENGRRLEEQKTAFEAELAQLKDQDDRHATAAKYHLEDLKVQAEIAQQAQQNYENELVKHAEAAKALQKVRSDYNQVKVEAVETKTEAESARTSLAQSKESWAESRERYERELADLRTGRENLNVQNNRLHQQLDNVSSQISNLQKRVTTSDVEESSGDLPVSSLENLQEVIKYLRREKEIIDVQWELSAQEGKRLKQQLNYTQTQLDETRLKLNQQRRVEEDSERTALTHNKLMETLNELNTFRESSVTLRNETRQAQASLAAKLKQVEELLAQVEPLQAEIRELKNENETQVGENTLLKEDRDHWRQRTQNILQKYDRVDPAELEALKGDLETLKAERDDHLSSKQSLQGELDGMAGQVTKAQEQGNEKVEELRQRLTDQFKTRSKTLSALIKEKDAALQNAAKEKHDLEQQLSCLQDEVETAKLQRDQAVEGAETDFNGQSGAEEGQVDEDGPANSTEADIKVLQDKLGAAESRVSEEVTRSTSLQAESVACQSRISELELRISEQESQIVSLVLEFGLLPGANQIAQKQLQQSLDKSSADLLQLSIQQQQQSSLPPSSVSEEQIKKLRQDLVQSQQDVEDLRASASISSSIANVPAEDGTTSVAEQVTAHVDEIRLELESRHNERVKQAEETYQKRTDFMKAQLNKKIPEIKDQLRQTLAGEHDQVLQALKSAHVLEVENLKLRHQEEIKELHQIEDSRFASLKEGWPREIQSSNNADNSTTESESQVSRRSWEPSEAEVKDFIASNATVKDILSRNITTKVSKAREALTTQLKEEHEKALTAKLTEAENKANTAKQHAVFTEEKRNSLKLSMAENRTRAMQFKLNIVQKAAEDTPQKPVVEVWIVVKDARPPPTPTQQPPNAGMGQKPVQSGTFGQPTPVVQKPAQSGTFGQPTPLTQGSQKSAPNPFGNAQHMAPPQSAQASQPPVSSTSPTQPRVIQQMQRPPNGLQQTTQQLSTAHSPSSNTPPKVPLGPSFQHPNAGTGPGALRSLQQSGLPVARGSSGTRGGPRGRFQGVGRGTPQSIETNRQLQGQQGRGSPTTSTTLSGGAKQFVPGNKRARDDGQESGEGGNGKRPRGGFGGGGDES